MNRRHFLKSSSAFATGSICLPQRSIPFSKNKDVIIGHGDFKYKVDNKWGTLNPQKFPVKDCHEMVQDAKGKIYLLTNHTKNNVLVYNTAGKLINSWGTEYPGGHGLTINDEGGTEYLYLTDYERHEVIKTTLDGKVIMTLPCPLESEQYSKVEDYKPTETTIAPNGDIFVTDGYGEQWVIHYDEKGRLKNIFGGKDIFYNAHGICLDQRGGKDPVLLVTARSQRKLIEFSLDGQLLREFSIPGAYICRPVIKGNEVYLATLISKPPWDSRTGFICILDNNNQVISVPGGSAPDPQNPLHQTLKIFQHPHDVCVDKDDNIYVAQWNSGQTYPIKLQRV